MNETSGRLGAEDGERRAVRALWEDLSEGGESGETFTSGSKALCLPCPLGLMNFELVRNTDANLEHVSAGRLV